VLDFTAASRLRRQLDELPEILAFAYLALLPGSAPRGGRVSGATRTPPLPCTLNTLSDLAPGPTEDVPGTDRLQSWARAVLDDRRTANDWTAWTALPAIRREIPASTALKILGFHLPFAVTRPYAGDLAAEIDELHRHLNRVARHPIKSARPVKSPCPACQLLALCERTDGWRECLSCRETFSPAEYDAAAEKLLGELHAAA
jgi:hypothetical protein